jgi:hypothetical protein
MKISGISILSVIAVFAIFALAVLSVSARPLAAPAKISIAKQAAHTGTPASFATNEQAVQIESINQITTGVKMPLEELQRFDFKIGNTAKRLDGHTGKREHVPIERNSNRPPFEKDSSFY